jgi:3'-5' exoribonuclease
MARIFIADLRAGDRIDDQVFLIRTKDLRTTTQGSLYIHTILVDATGQIPARMWQATEGQFESMPDGGFMRFKGRVESYKGNLQFIIDGMQFVEPGSVDLSEFLPATDKDVELMWTRVKEILRQVKDPHVLALLAEFVNDAETTQAFLRSPAAAQLHHAYIGGLVEHTLNVLELALLVMPRYPFVSMDLVLAGVFLHDLAKTAELSSDTTFSYTTRGQLVGHVVMAAIWIEEKCKAVAQKQGKPFPDEIRDALQHIVLAHHGQYEFGSPRLPAMPEAIAVHYLDNIDAKLHQFQQAIMDDPDPDSQWTQFVRALNTRVYKGDVLGIRRD